MPSPVRTTTTLRPAPQQPKTHVFNHLPAAGRHTWGSTANSPPAASDGARAGRVALAYPEPRLSPTQTPVPSTSTRQPSAQGPYQLVRAQQLAKKLLLRHSALDPGRQSVPTRTQSATDRKHGLAQADGQFQSKNPCRHSTYLIGTAQNHHRGPLSRSGSDVPTQQLSRYAGAAVWPAHGRPDDTLHTTTQPNSRASASAASKIRHVLDREGGERVGSRDGGVPAW